MLNLLIEVHDHWRLRGGGGRIVYEDTLDSCHVKYARLLGKTFLPLRCIHHKRSGGPPIAMNMNL